MTDLKPAGNWITHVPPAILIVLAGATVSFIKVTSDHRIEHLEARANTADKFMICQLRLGDWRDNDRVGKKPCELEVME